MEAIRLNSYLWGGVLNPIIPCIGSVPTIWSQTPLGHFITAESMIDDLIQRFDP